MKKEKQYKLINGKGYGQLIEGSVYPVKYKAETSSDTVEACVKMYPEDWELVEEKTKIEILEAKYNKREEKQKKLAARIAEIKNRCVLKIKVRDNEVIFATGHDTNLGYITADGSCYIMSDVNSQEAWEEWAQNGMRASNDIVEWRGGQYKIDSFKCFSRIDKGDDSIYDFKFCQPEGTCKDDNIQRYSNETPKIF